jgi:uroporphyrinogen decarboxylase
MRQAGRYMPEYRALREKYDLLTMCRTPELAVQVTLQPLRRFDLDAAILFSDIMIPLRGMGVDFEIREGVGPVITHPIRTTEDVEALRIVDPECDVPFVMETLRALRRELHVPLIGFAGAPFTLASYLIEGKGSRELHKTKQFMYTQPAAWHALMGKLALTIGAFLRAQVQAGAQAIQLFDSWVGALSPDDYERYVLLYSRIIFDEVETTNVPRIHFGTGTAMLLEQMRDAGASVIGLDWRVPLDQARTRLGEVGVQGNLDPCIMLSSPELVEQEARKVLSRAGSAPGYIFNLGHGILPETPTENVERLIRVVHEAGRVDA